jgi:hypothetical protein
VNVSGHNLLKSIFYTVKAKTVNGNDYEVSYQLMHSSTFYLFYTYVFIYLFNSPSIRAEIWTSSIDCDHQCSRFPEGGKRVQPPKRRFKYKLE